MARLKTVRTSDYPYHITTRCNNREWFDVPMSEVWNFALDALKYANKKVKVSIEGFVLMSNHYHLVLHTPDANIDEFMRNFNWKFSKHLRDKTKRINHIFGGRYNWKIINNHRYYYEVMRYLFQNPLKVKLVERCEDYEFSTLYYQKRDIMLEIDLNNNWAREDLVTWYNERVDNKKIGEALEKNGFFKLGANE